MLEISPPEFYKAVPIFEHIDHSLAIVYAVLEGNSPGRVFVDDAAGAAVALLYAEGAFFYIGGNEHNAGLRQALVPLLFHHILPELEEKEIVLFAFSDAWRHTLDELLREQGVIQISRKVFEFNPEKFTPHRDWKTRLPQGFTMRAIDAQLAEQDPIYREIVNPASKRLGVCLMHGDEIACECSAVFVGRGQAEIDIHTREAYQGRGYATLTASAFIETCLARGLKPNWSCWPERQASVALAKRLGFEELPDIPAHLWAEDM